MIRVVVTGGAGFIGSHVCELLSARGDEVVCFDNLTYAGSPDNLERLRSSRNFAFTKADITDAPMVRTAIRGADAVINCAAETHVDRSLLTPARFAHTDAYGAAILLEEARVARVGVVLQVSTDEVYGPIVDGEATEDRALRPQSPYAASKAGGDLLAQAFSQTFGLDVRVTRGCNAYGPRQHPEKFVPLMITSAMSGVPLPIYGDGRQEREWCYVADHASAIVTVLDRGTAGSVYNIGTGERVANLDVVRRILEIVGSGTDLIKYISDRPGHDRRYAVSSQRLRGLGWKPTRTFQDGLRQTVSWYEENEGWWRALRQASEDYFERMYGRREETLSTLMIPAN